MSEPNSLIVDVTTGIKPGMVYVMLSRVCSIEQLFIVNKIDPEKIRVCLLYTSPSPRDATLARMPSSA